MMLNSAIRSRLLLVILIVAILSGCSLSKKIDQDETIFKPSQDYTKNAENLAAEEEDAIGKAVAYRIMAATPAVKSEVLNSYVNAVGQVVAAASDRAETFAGYRFLVIDSNEINAMAAPGGYIFVSRGFIEAIKDEDSLAAVLAHEVSHVVMKHGLAAIKPEHYADYVAVGALLGSAVDCSGVSQQLLVSFGAAAGDIYEKLTVAGYSRDQEFDADKLALKILEKAGYKPEALNTALELIKQSKSKSGGWFGTHPNPDDRIKETKILIKNIELSTAGYEQRKERFEAAKAKLKV